MISTPPSLSIREGPNASLLADLGVSCRAAGIEAAEMWSAVVAGDVSIEPDDPHGLCDEPPLVPWRDTHAPSGSMRSQPNSDE